MARASGYVPAPLVGLLTLAHSSAAKIWVAALSWLEWVSTRCYAAQAYEW